MSDFGEMKTFHVYGRNQPVTGKPRAFVVVALTGADAVQVVLSHHVLKGDRVGAQRSTWRFTRVDRDKPRIIGVVP
jgi:hypothetical protein